MSIRSKLRIRSRVRSFIHRVWQPRPKPLILMYHRIANDPIDAWGLSVSPDRFAEQLNVLNRTRRPLPLADFVRKFIAGTLPTNAVALTFDDGYVDNLTAGKPRLTVAGVPATVFLATGYLDRPGEFWWDELTKLILAGKGPSKFALEVGGRSVQVDLGTETIGHSSPAGATRRAALTRLWEAMQRQTNDEHLSVLTKLRSILADGYHGADKGRAMTREEVRKLTTDGLITIGAHTVTHPLLTTLNDADYHREIAQSKLACDSLSDAPTVGFTYPYGGFDHKVRDAVSLAGFAFACTTRHASVGATSDIFALPRIHVFNWGGEAFERAIQQW